MDLEVTKDTEMSRVQQTAIELIEELIKPAKLNRDLFISLILTIMKENDFVLINEVYEPIAIVDYVTERRYSNTEIYEVLYILNGFPKLISKIIACPIDDTLLIIATIPQLFQETFSFCFPIYNFIELSELGAPKALINLSQLNSTYKNHILVPLKSTILNYHRYPSGNLSGLPDDVVHQIILNLSLRYILNLSETCKRIHRIVKTDSIWHRLYKRDFPDKDKIETDDWLELYKEVYDVKQREEFEAVKNIRTEDVDEFEVLSNYMRQVNARWEVIL